MSSGRSEGVVRNSGMSKTEKTDKPDKKPFDKKKWRENKYSNKVKGKNVGKLYNALFLTAKTKFIIAYFSRIYGSLLLEQLLSESWEGFFTDHLQKYLQPKA